MGWLFAQAKKAGAKGSRGATWTAKPPTDTPPSQSSAQIAEYERLRLGAPGLGPQADPPILYAFRHPRGSFICYCPGKKSLIAVAAASLAVSGASPQAVSIVRSRL
jgi:hypothetical protein